MLSQFLLFLLDKWNSCFLYSLDFFYLNSFKLKQHFSFESLFHGTMLHVVVGSFRCMANCHVKFNSLYYGLLLIINSYILACVNPSILLIKECLFLSFKDAERGYLSIRATKLKDVDRI